MREKPASALHPQAAHGAALREGVGEHFELHAADDVADIDDLHAETDVGLVGAVTAHGLGVS